MVWRTDGIWGMEWIMIRITETFLWKTDQVYRREDDTPASADPSGVAAQGESWGVLVVKDGGVQRERLRCGDCPLRENWELGREILYNFKAQYLNKNKKIRSGSKLKEIEVELFPMYFRQSISNAKHNCLLFDLSILESFFPGAQWCWARNTWTGRGRTCAG